MKLFALGTLGLALSIGTVTARTWTSSDGSKTFEGTFKDYDEAKQTISVMKGYKKLSFPLDKLSDTDQQWVRGEVARQAIANQPTVQEQLAEQAVGKNLKPGVLERLEGSRFARVELSKAPEYYLLYFSASW